MNERFKISIWVYAALFAVVAAAGCFAACSGRTSSSFRPASTGSSSGKVLTAFLSYQWHSRGVTTIPYFPVYTTVLIDPGHGGKDPGAQGVGGALEKDIVLDIGVRLRKILESRGVLVRMTRDNDQFFSLEERVSMIDRYGADVFLSLHANSSSDRSASGVEIYYAQAETYWAAINQTLNNVIGDSIESVFDARTEIYQYNNHKRTFRTQAQNLARHMASQLAAATGARNRGIKSQRFYVVSEAKVPAILLELGFMTNPEEGRKLATEEYRQTLAETLAESLLNYVQSE